MKSIRAILGIFTLAVIIGGAVVGIGLFGDYIGRLNRCDCTVTWNNASIPVEDAIEQIGEGLLELNNSINNSCEEEQ